MIYVVVGVLLVVLFAVVWCVKTSRELKRDFDNIFMG